MNDRFRKAPSLRREYALALILGAVWGHLPIWNQLFAPFDQSYNAQVVFSVQHGCTMVLRDPCTLSALHRFERFVIGTPRIGLNI
jgi:hypothetical protein